MLLSTIILAYIWNNQIYHIYLPIQKLHSNYVKRIFAIIFAIISLSIFYNIESGEVCNSIAEQSEQITIEYFEQSFTQCDNYVELNGRQGGSSALSSSRTITKNIASRRSIFDSLSGVKHARASLYSECGYSYSCDFPFEHQPQRELFFILRNIRI